MTASQVLATTPQTAESRYALVLTTESDQVRVAQRLRHGVLGVRDRALACHLSPEPFRVRPFVPWEPHGITSPRRLVMPPLVQGYLRLGAWVCGPPAYDPAFDCADFLVLLGLDHMDPRYVRYFLGGA